MTLAVPPAAAWLADVRSATHHDEGTDQFGLQVRRAVEVLIESLDRADQDHGATNDNQWAC